MGRDLVSGLVAAQKLKWEGTWCRTGGSTEGSVGRDLVSGLVAEQKLTWEGTWCQDWWQHRS